MACCADKLVEMGVGVAEPVRGPALPFEKYANAEAGVDMNESLRTMVPVTYDPSMTMLFIFTSEFMTRTFASLYRILQIPLFPRIWIK